MEEQPAETTKPKKQLKIDFNFLPRRVRSFINSHGNDEITSMFVARSVIDSKVESFLNTISFGLLNKVKRKLNYDKLFHLKLVINGKYVYEKNQSVNIGGSYSPGKDEERMDVKVPSGLTISEFLNNGMRRMGTRFFKYDAFNQNGGGNCQDYIRANLVANGIMTSELLKFIQQDIKTIAQGLPSYVKDASRSITDIAKISDYLRQELGFSKGGVIGTKGPLLFPGRHSEIYFTLP